MASLTAELISLGQTLTNAMDAAPGFVPCGHAFGELASGFVALGGADEQAAAESAHDRAAHIADHRGVELGAVVELAGTEPERTELLSSAKQVAGSVAAALQAGTEAQDACIFLAHAAAALGHTDNAGELEALLAQGANL